MRWLALFFPVALLLVAGAIYLGAGDNERLPDESLAIWSNPAVTQPSWGGVVLGRFYDSTTESRPAVRPVATLAHRLEFDMFHQSRRGFQWMLVLAHAAAGIALFALFRAQFGSPVSAFAGSLLFVAHPALSASILTLPGISESLALLWSVIALLAAGRILRNPAPAGQKPWGSLVLAWIALWVAVWCKETALLLVPAILCWAWASRSAGPERQGWSRAVGLLVTGAVAIAVIVLTHRLISWETLPTAERAPAILIDSGEAWGRRALLGMAGVSSYLQLALFPFELAYVYDFVSQWSGAGLGARLGVGLLILAGLSVGLVVALRRRSANSALWFGLTLFALLAGTGMIAPIGDYLSERMMYFILPGVLGLSLMLHRRILAPRGELWSAAVFVLAVIIAGAFGVRTALRERDHQTLETLIRKQIAVHPESAQAHYELGNQYLSRGQFAAARDSYERATELRPDLWMAWINIGASYFAQEDYGLARRAFTHAVDGIGGRDAFRTADARARYNRALVLMRQNENAEAAKDLEAALLVFPNHMAAHANLGFIYRNSQRFDEQALSHLGRALELDADPDRRKGLEEAIAFIEARAREAAESPFAESTSVTPEDLPDTTVQESPQQP